MCAVRTRYRTGTDVKTVASATSNSSFTTARWRLKIDEIGGKSQEPRTKRSTRKNHNHQHHPYRTVSFISFYPTSANPQERDLNPTFRRHLFLLSEHIYFCCLSRALKAKMQGVTRNLLRRKLPSPSFSPICSTARSLSALASVEWSNSDKCQLIPPSSIRRAQDQQIRFRRHDRASAFTKPRPKTKKQRQVYNRKVKRNEDEKAKHNPPGFRAGPRRQFIRERWQQLIDQASVPNGKELVVSGDDQEDEYGVEDALMEDLLGNTSHLTSQPTPEPVYLGHLHKKYYNIVADQMDRYREAIEAQARARLKENESDGQAQVLDLSTGAAELPSDKSISKALRAYRDRHGTRSQPIGIAMALEHLLKDLCVPIVAFGEYTFTTLLTCCRTPVEARRIMKLMTDQQHPISAYSWSILVDIHAKLGDFEGCAHVIKEMAFEGTPPTQAAYTSLLAACHKVCNDGRIPHAIRAKAGEIGWDHWQEMRIVGIDADAMAYGAIIRLCAARGQAERAINLLEEMNRFDVKPTTLCFSGALRAVARSHEIGVRFERGSSKKQLRRELFAAHHGKMARQILIMAENAEVVQDESFVSALMLCAAAAGDSATAKAVFLAAEVRKMDHLRTIGPDSSLQLLRGDSRPMSLGGRARHVEQQPALLAGVAEHEHDGTEGQTNVSQTSSPAPFVEPRVPQIQNHRELALKSFGEREYGTDTRALSALLRSCGQAMSGNGLGTMWAGRSNQGYLDENSLRLITTRREPNYTQTSIPDELSTKVGVSLLRRFDENDHDEPRKKGAGRQKFRGLYLDDDAVETIEEYADIYDRSRHAGDEGDLLESNGSHAGYLAGNQNEPSFRPIQTSQIFATHDNVTRSEEIMSEAQSLEGFNLFFKELQEEAKADDLEEDLSEEDARELFQMLQEEFAAGIDIENYTQDEKRASQHLLHEESDDLVGDFSVEDTVTLLVPDLDRTEVSAGTRDTKGSLVPSLTELDRTRSDRGDLKDSWLERIEDLQSALPGMPIGRIKKVAKAFESTLGYPSLLTLVPILRESLPDHLTVGYLKQINKRNADFVLQRAEEDGLVDQSLLNAMLQVKTSASSLDEAEHFHRDEFRRHNLNPNAYSDRLMLQMFVDNHRLPRALDFKHRIENEKRTLDLPSYGTLVDYYARHQQLGSAISLLKECFEVHGSSPSEKYISSTRLLARQLQMHGGLRLDELLGKDPTEWLKHGERHLKRERSQKGRRNVQMAYNRILG